MLKFEHGGDIKAFAKSIKSKEKDIIDLSSNINFIKPKIKIDFNQLEISAYPTYSKIYKQIAKLYGIKISQMELFNGGSSAIFSLFSQLNLKDCTIYSPAYLEYKKASEIFNYNLHLINRFDNIYDSIKKNSFVIFVNPSTPDGKYYDLDKLFKIWKKANATVLIDESFLDFTNYPSAIKYLKTYKKLYILKSMTKIYSSAGIRIGTLISNKNNIKNLKNKQPAWKLSQFDTNYLSQALKDKSFIKKSININKKNKKYLKKILLNSNLFETIHTSKGNYILAKLKSLKAQEFQEILKSSKIMIRNCSNFDFLDNTYVRIAVKSKKKLSILNDSLNKIIEK